MSSEQQRTLLAITLSVLILLGWQFFVEPVVNPPKVQQTIVKEEGKLTETERPSTSSSKNTLSSAINATTEKIDETLLYDLTSPLVDYKINSFLTVEDSIFKSTQTSYSKLFPKGSSDQLLFEINGKFQKVPFNIKKTDEQTLVFSNENLGISGLIKLDEKGMLNFSFDLQNEMRYAFLLKSKESKLENGQINNFSYFTDSLNTVAVGSDESGALDFQWFALDFNYFIYSNVFPKKEKHLYEISEAGMFKISSTKPVTSLSFKSIFVRKEYDTLMGLGSNLHQAVDFGMMAIIAIPILRGLQFFYTLIPNYGISIILLTLIIRMLTFPLQYKSFKSMKKMQEVQPELAKLRDKYKEDPQKLQLETMNLFKKAGANPLGGCLPLILQMPIFFAFYRVLYSAVELVDAPFMGWIHDLSEKDPYYVLPILMSVTMFFQQKLTPSQTADPNQQKIMMFMPLIFAVFMKDMPAGLTLYIFISTLMGIGQQLFVYKRT